MSSEHDVYLGQPAASISWDDTTPKSDQFDDIYYSRQSGIKESRHVFLSANKLPERWAGSKRHRILETGFGTGLNFLCCWQLWQQSAHRCERLHYIAIEKFPLRWEDLARALGAFAELSPLAQALIQQYPPPLPGQQRLIFEQGKVTLDLVYGDVADALSALCEQHELSIDTWFLDGFAPARNHTMWDEPVLKAIGELSSTNSQLATFTAAGAVKRGLTANGFSIEKVPGYGSKREMLVGSYMGTSKKPASSYLSWDLASQPAANDRTIVIGAGLAGASVANALARKGRRVHVLDAGLIASGASGNQQGVLYTRISHRPSTLNSFSLLSYCFALREYRLLMDAEKLSEGRDGEFCGFLQLQANNTALDATLASLPNIALQLDSRQAAEISGLENCPPALFFPGGGWLNPTAVCKALLENPLIDSTENTGPLEIKRTDKLWEVLDRDGNSVASAETLVIAAGHYCDNFAGAAHLPLQKIRGQITRLPTTDTLRYLRTVVCHDGYIPPAIDGAHWLGASFDLDDNDIQPSQASHRDNLQKLSENLNIQLPETVTDKLGELEGRVGFRCASPDYLPIVGPVPDLEELRREYGFLRKNARHRRPSSPCNVPGLFISTAHGSRGLTSTPLAAEHLACQISGEISPLDRTISQALSPARFAIRDLIRHRD